MITRNVAVVVWRTEEPREVFEQGRSVDCYCMVDPPPHTHTFSFAENRTKENIFLDMLKLIFHKLKILKTKKLPLFSEKSGSILFQLSDVP
jgi:hypothetical protein